MSSDAPIRPVPIGFHLCCIAALCCTMAVGIALRVATFDPHLPRWVAPLRGALMLLLTVGLFTIQALSDGRPSAYPASVALAVSYSLAAAALIVVNPSVWIPVVTLYTLSTAVVLPILLYLRGRSRQFWPRGGVR